MARPSRSKTSAAKTRKVSPAKGRKTTKTKRRIAPAATRVKRRSVSDPSKDLKEAREQQAATAEILKVINASRGDLTPVFDIILEKAHGLCDVPCGSLQLFDDGHTRAVAVRGMSEPFEKFLRQGYRLDRSQPVQSGRPFQIDDLTKVIVGASHGSALRVAFELGCLRTVLSVPLVRDGVVFGRILAGRQEVRPFAEHQIAVLQSFADQAVIAIENTRLFNETQKALERQTATAEILKVIASSPSDVQPVFDAIATSSKWLVGAFSAVVFRFVDGVAHVVAFTPTSPAADQLLKASFPRPVAEFPPFERAHAGGVVQVPDTEAEPDERMKQLARARGFRSVLNAPLMSKETPLGMITVTRKDPGPFAAHHIQLLQTFADQAIIAIENARLFNEVQAKTRDLTESLQQQTATADVLKVISASPGELEPVFKAMLENATNICEANFGHMFLRDGDDFRVAALRSKEAANPYWLTLGQRLAALDNPDGPLAQIVRTEEIVHIVDLASEASYAERNPRMVALVESSGARTFLGVPMFKDDGMIGVIAIYRQDVRPFTQKQIALVSSFAAQAVIAIENARLLNELKMRTTELSRSLDDLRTAQDRLVQTEKLASLGHLTAGIAHEIKNPLNFVNNFSSLSAELVDELDETLAPAPLDQKMRGDVGDLTAMLKSNLEKVVQHGKRADSIVKNMLLHSREGSGEHRPADINAIVDESLNLAYHGARAEKTGFSMDFQRDLDPSVGMADVYPQEITRVLLNLISNGFYATTRRKAEAGDGFEPMLSASTKNLGDKVEIRIRDNGTGIPDDVKEKIFNPFFTTKPSGEGTGLGLSMSHDIIVKQHGGSIDVATEPGLFTEFKIVLPRTNQR